MLRFSLLLAATTIVSLTSAQETPKFQFQEIFRWNTIEPVWPSEEAQTRAYERKEYIPANNALAGIKIWKDKMYLTVPRWKEGVPVTLGVISMKLINQTSAPKLEAYPNWDMQTIGDCNAFQFVQSMEIDPKGRMWVLDTGRTEIMTLEAKARCPPRLVILDLENEGKQLKSYDFPEDVTSPKTAYLNDIVLDHEDGGFAYISDNSDADPGIIVYSLRNNTSWKVRDNSMKVEPDAVNFMINKVRVISAIPVDGIALSPASSAERWLYYTPLSSFRLYALPTWLLKNAKNFEVHPYVREWGRRNSQTDGMMMSSTGILYYGLLADDAISLWNTSLPFTTGQRVISRDHRIMQWPDTFAFDEEGYLYCVTNSLHTFMIDRVNVSAPNYHIVRQQIPDTRSYQYYKNTTAPELPTAGADHIHIALGTCLAVLLVLAIK